MPLSHPQAQALPGSSSTSRKRTHAEITRSESRSQTPPPPSKRRRTIPSSRSTSSSPNSRARSPERVRFSGDGLDYRQPVMSAESNLQPHTQDTIDLTLEDDSPSPGRLTNEFASRNASSTFDSITFGNGPIARAPPFVPQQIGQNQPVIDLSSDDDEDDTRIEGDDGTTMNPSSPEIQFMGARPLPQPPDANNGNTGGRRPRISPRPPLGRQMANLVRDMTQNVFGNLNRALPEHFLHQIYDYRAIGSGVMEMPPEPLNNTYDSIQMDYQQPGFDLETPDLLLIADPHFQPPAPNRPAYKEPPPVRDGFTRNYEEDDMLVCGLCGDELATGETEQKQQVWIVKQCGHAYCGDCRSITKQKKKTNNFTTCAIPDCKKAVNSKTKMFQIYL